MEFNIGDKRYYENTPQEDILAMQDACVENGWSLEDGTDNGGYYYIIREIVPILPSLAEVKATKRAEINAIRDEKEVEPLNNYDVDLKSAVRILFVQNKLLRDGGTIDWTMADNTEENVNVTDMNDIVDALVEQSNKVHNIANYLKAQVDACTTVAQVEAIHWIDELPTE